VVGLLLIEREESVKILMTEHCCCCYD
jgi:hypothetical protein